MIARQPITPASLIVLLSVAACAGKAAPVSSPTRPAAQAESSEARALRGAFKGKLHRFPDRVRFRGTVALVTPDRLYLDLSGPVGGVRAIMATRGSRVTLLLPRTRQFLDEPATPAIYKALLGAPLETRGLIELILSADPAASAPGAPPRRIDLEADPGGAARWLVVSREGELLRAHVASESGAEVSWGLELRLEGIERPAPEAIPENLFDAKPGPGWTRLDPAASDVGALLFLS